MLRRLGNGLMAVTILGVVGLVGLWGVDRFQRARNGGEAPRPTVQTSRIYELATQQWTRFPLPRPTTPLRLLVHADRPGASVDPSINEPVRFAVRVQAIGGNGAPIFERVHHFEAGVSWYTNPDADDQAPRPGKFYPDRSVIPSDSQRAVIDLPNPSAVESVRIKPVATDAGVESINVRVYAPERLSGAKRSARWERLSGEQRTRLAKGNVYPPDLLSASERAQLSAVRWRPLGPAGVAGRDYRERKIYIRQASDMLSPSEPVRPEGVRVGPNRRASVRLPEGGGDFVIAFEALAPGDGEVEMIAYDGAEGRVAREVVAWRDDEVRVDRRWSGRLLELRSDVPAMVRLVSNANADANTKAKPPPQPEPGIVRVYRTDAAPRWAVRHAGGQPTPFRVDLRCACFGPDGGRLALGSARIEILGSNGRILERIPVIIDSPLSRYEQVRQGGTDTLVGEARSLYFRVPPDGVALRVVGDRRVVAAAFNRPDGLRRTIRVPEYRYARAPDALRVHRSWFYLPPDNLGAGSPASTVVSIQEPPPEIDPRLQAGDYDWTTYRPEGEWSARRLLTPTDPPEPERRPEALGTTYTELRAGGVHDVTIAAASPRPVRPELVFTGNTAGRARLHVSVDGSPHMVRTLRAASGRLSLPPVRLGRHRLRIDTDTDTDTRFYLSNIAAGGGSAYGLRLANRIAPGTTDFVFEKTSPGAELLSFRFYPSLPAPDRRIVDVTIGEAAVTDIGPHEDLTLRRRRYDLRIDAESEYPVLGAADRSVGAERRFVAELGADLPPGRYPVTLRVDGSGEAFVTMSTAKPGRSETRGTQKGGLE